MKQVLGTDDQGQTDNKFTNINTLLQESKSQIQDLRELNRLQADGFKEQENNYLKEIQKLNKKLAKQKQQFNSKIEEAQRMALEQTEQLENDQMKER